MRAFVPWLLATAGLMACDAPASSSGGPAGGEATFGFRAFDAVDVLLMVDNSAAVIGHGELALGLPALLDELRAVPGGRPHLHLGLVTSDLGAGLAPVPSLCRPGGDGGLLQTYACGLPARQRFISAAGGAGALPAEVTGPLACLINSVGMRGCGYEHQLASVAALLAGPLAPENAGFIRPEAHLLILLFTDEDDCSAPPDTDLFARELPGIGSSARCALAGHSCFGAFPPATEFKVPMSACQGAEAGPLVSLASQVDYLSRLKRISGAINTVTVAGIFGTPSAHPEVPYELRRVGGTLEYASSCQSRLGTAYLAPRLASFIDALGPGGLSEDICADDLTPGLARIGKAVARRLSSTCLSPDVENCRVHAGGVPVPPCSASLREGCWTIANHASCQGGLRLTVEAASRVPAGADITITCTTRVR